MRLGTKGSEDSEKFFESHNLNILKESVVKHAPIFFNNNMEKYRIAFTVEDYYDYIGTSPYYSIKKRMLYSIPDQFRKNGYNIKFKTLHRYWHKYYRVHMSVKMTEEEIKEVFGKYKNMIFKLENISYKLIFNHF